MPFELYPDAFGDPRNARACAMACDLAYLRDGAAGTAKYKEEFGLDAKLISVNNTQAYFGANDQHILVAFRGSEAPTSIDGLKDWLLTNAVNLLIVPEGELGTDYIAAGVGARFHKGFMMALADIWDPLYAEVDAAMQAHERPLWVTGHSLGGALAQLASWRFSRRFVPVHQIYTFGAPMVGNQAANQAFDKEFAGRMFRYVHLTDLVPKLPTVSLVANDYCHCEREVAVGEGESATACLQSINAEAPEQTLTAGLMDKIWGALNARLLAHDIANYRNLIR